MSIILVDQQKKEYDPVLSGADEWPVVKLARSRKEFIDEVIKSTVETIKSQRPTPGQLKEEIELTMFREILRVKENPWKIDPDDEMLFWQKIRKRMAGLSVSDKEELTEAMGDILQKIVTRYVNEIAGNFKKSRYRLTRTIVTFGFSRLLNAARFRGIKGLFKGRLTLQDKIHIRGYPETVRKLARIGTIIMVPTHFSNLDSVTIGWVINTLGLPPFIYGAGLNLFNISIFAYFMNSLGAYKVDRRKKNMIYLETLKTYSSLALRKGCHSLFFPGGTRSRSGMIEKKLKLGLLGTAIETQRMNIVNSNGSEPQKIFVVPVVINYTFVLEAVQLIRDYLAQKGQERYYLESDRYSNSFKIFSYLIRFFLHGSNISVTMGKAMDLFGNYVDEEGRSLDRNGNVIDIRDYFLLHGAITVDKQRESEYTKKLADKIISEFHSNSRVFASHLCAFIAFEMLRKKHSRLDLYNFLRLPTEELVVRYQEFRENFGKLRQVIFDMEKKRLIQSSDHLMIDDIDELIRFGIHNVGIFHTRRPLIIDREGNITTKDLNTLYYYRNRLDGYGLEKYI
ncbi:MAG TPA: 1-acyl-sn-glycerol-3-phosphate acyltransferase [Cyclobacteriaceae bacterium]|nr:1-acyl-sn-glycerol-3-phosphate acyltransferase [Cyclobacteriaceae bacterium]